MTQILTFAPSVLPVFFFLGLLCGILLMWFLGGADNEEFATEEPSAFTKQKEPAEADPKKVAAEGAVLWPWGTHQATQENGEASSLEGLTACAAWCHPWQRSGCRPRWWLR